MNQIRSIQTKVPYSFQKINSTNDLSKKTDLNQVLIAINIITVSLEFILMCCETYYLPVPHFIGYHTPAIIWSVFYLLITPLRNSVIFKIIASIISMIFVMMGILFVYLYAIEFSYKSKQFYLEIILLFVGPSALVGLSLLSLLYLNTEEGSLFHAQYIQPSHLDQEQQQAKNKNQQISWYYLISS